MARNYSNVAVVTTLENSGGVTPTTTQIILLSTSGYPTQFPFTLRLSPDTGNEEIVTVNSGGGSSASPYSVTRGADGTLAKSHPQFAVVTHGFSARDFKEPQTHIDDTIKHVRRPLYEHQVAEPPYNITSTFVAFSFASWNSITFTAPASGLIKVTIGAALFNNNTTSSTAWVNYRASGGLTLEGSEYHGVSAAGTRVYASRTRILEGLTPGVSTTITPTWNISSGSAATAYIGNGQLIVELLP